jgi:diguanylate cyclase (GGDEF)-like protein
VESLKLKTKLLYLLLVVGFGLIVVGLVGYFNLRTMKNHVDTLYFGSLTPMSELTTITDTYHDQLGGTLYQWSHNLISDEQAAQTITSGLNTIDQMWRSYLSHEKRPEEMPYVDYTESQIELMRSYFSQIRSLVLDPERPHPLSLIVLSDNIASIHTTIHQLITYENGAARYEHSLMLAHHQNALTQLIVLLSVILGLVMGLTWMIFTRIELQQRQLIESSETLKHLNLKLEHASYTDSLTALYNRRYFNIVYERELKRALRSEKFFVFLMLDIDFFKQYNDTYGHLQGDVALQTVAKVLKSSLQRPGDYPFRLGGEEFGVIITDTDCMNARAMGEKIRTNIEDLKIEHKGSKVSAILTVSIGGVCIIPTSPLGDEALIHTADTNLYAAKERGRNQVVFTNTL